MHTNCEQKGVFVVLKLESAGGRFIFRLEVRQLGCWALTGVIPFITSAGAGESVNLGLSLTEKLSITYKQSSPSF